MERIEQIVEKYVENERLFLVDEAEFLPLGPVPVELWGSDHWSTLGYIETRCVDGLPVQNSRMRNSDLLHPGLIGRHPVEGGDQSGEFLTRLRDGFEVGKHDDWSCVEDFIAYGLMRIRSVREGDKHYQEETALVSVEIELTPQGEGLVNHIQSHKRSGKNWSEFSLLEVFDGSVVKTGFNVDMERYGEARDVLRAEDPVKEFWSKRAETA